MRSLTLIESSLSERGVIKLLFKNIKGQKFESVIIPNHNKKRSNICLSTQSGCTIGCIFCLTHMMNSKINNLSFKDIIHQFIISKEIARKKYPDYIFDDTLLFGMGEPLLNFNNLKKVLIYFEDNNIHSAISTIGISKGIKKLMKLGLKKIPRLQISLHKLNRREKIIPYEKIDPIINTLNICDRYKKISKKHITLNYILLKGINDNLSEIKQLANFNPNIFELKLSYYSGKKFSSPTDKRIYKIIKLIKYYSLKKFKKSIKVRIFRSHGEDIFAVCGQLCGYYKKS